MRYNVGDFVKGTEMHCNFARTVDVGVVLSQEKGLGGYWVAWFNDKSTHFAEECELELVKVGDFF